MAVIENKNFLMIKKIDKNNPKFLKCKIDIESV